MELPAAEASPLPHPRQLQGPPKPATRPLPRQAYSSPLLPVLVRLGPGAPSGGKMQHHISCLPLKGGSKWGEAAGVVSKSGFVYVSDTSTGWQMALQAADHESHF